MKIPNQNRYWLFFLVQFIGLVIFPLKAQSSPPVYSANTEVELISEVLSVEPGISFWVALRMTMDPHWHTYWKNPGDSGLPTTIEWSLPEGFLAEDIQWTYPQRIDVDPLTTYAYEGEVYHFTQIHVPKNLTLGQPVEIKAHARWLACELICIPGEAQLNLELPVLSGLAKKNPAHINQFRVQRSKLPISSSGWNVEATRLKDQIDLRLSQLNRHNLNISNIQFFPDKEQVIKHSADQPFLKDEDQFELTLTKAPLKEGPVNRLKGVLIADSGWLGQGTQLAMAIDVPVIEMISHAMSPQSAQGLNAIGLALVFAFLGGLILNLMPCVLPVLSIKILNLVEHANEEKSKSFAHGAAFSIGIIVTFWILVGILLLLKLAGKQVGWGFQFQSPVFLILMSMLFYWMGLNLFGLFEVGTSLTRLESGQRTVFSLKSSFMNGMLATIVATPCTAPFMGSALGFALVQPPAYAFLIFTFLGLGLAFPFLLLSAVPSLLKFIPKPGPWMITLKKVFGILFLVTVLWLASVLGIQKGQNAVIGMAFGLLGLSLAGWIYGKWGAPVNSASIRRKASFGVLALFLVSFALAYKGAYLDRYVALDFATSKQSDIQWLNYSAKLIEGTRREHKPIFLDFTASWCLSCQVNDRIAFKNERVISKFRELGIVPVKADWTNYDEDITEALAAFGKSSIPLYVLYPKDPNKPPILLPEIITPGIVIEALEKNLIE